MNRLISSLLLLAGCSDPYPPPFINPASLQALLFVHSVEVAPAKAKRTRQIIHIENWHFVDRAEFIADLETEAGKPLTEEQIELEWAAFFDDVEAVQADQKDLLQELVMSHGVKAIYLEGLTDADMDEYRKLATTLKNWKEPGADDALSEFLRQQHRQDSLLLGAASRVEGLEVLPAEDAEAMEAANPVKNGRVDFDDAATERREDAIVRNVLTSESPVAVLILGGGHDLSDNVEAIGGGAVEYVRVQVKAHREAAGPE